MSLWVVVEEPRSPAIVRVHTSLVPVSVAATPNTRTYTKTTCDRMFSTFSDAPNSLNDKSNSQFNPTPMSRRQPQDTATTKARTTILKHRPMNLVVDECRFMIGLYTPMPTLGREALTAASMSSISSGVT